MLYYLSFILIIIIDFVSLTLLNLGAGKEDDSAV